MSDQPLNPWLEDRLAGHRGGLILISHDVELLEAVVNRVLHLDANRAAIDTYNIGWKAYLQQRQHIGELKAGPLGDKAAISVAGGDRSTASATISCSPRPVTSCSVAGAAARAARAGRPVRRPAPPRSPLSG